MQEIGHIGTTTSTFLLDPLYMLYNDSRFSTWRKMFDEYRICKVQMIIVPLTLSATTVADSNHGATMFCGWDRNGNYQTVTDTSATIST